MAGARGAFLLGVPFALAVCPFCTPALVVLLGVSAGIGSPRFGTALLLAFAPGRAVPILLGATTLILAHSARDRVSGIADPDSGGTTWFITPGLQYVTRKWIAETGLRIPVSRHPNGSALRSDYVLTAGFRINY